MTADYNFSVTGQTSDDIAVTFVSLGLAARSNAYQVSATLQDVASVVGMEITSVTSAGFHINCTAPLTATDVIQLHVYDTANTTVQATGIQVVIPAASFFVESGSGTYSDGIWTMGANSFLTTALQLPKGTQLDTLTLLNSRNLTAVVLNLTLCSRIFQSATHMFPKTTITAGNINVSLGTGWQTNSATSIGHIIANESLYIRIGSSATAGALIGHLFVSYSIV